MTIYLASQSPRRAELLQQIGVDFRLLLPQNAAEKAKQMRFLASRGFASGQISKWLRSVGAGTEVEAENEE